MADSWKNSSDLSGASDVSAAGRWPAHVVLSHADGCVRVGTMRVKAAPAWGEKHAPSLFAGEATSPVHHSDSDGFETVEDWKCVEGCPVKLLNEQSGTLTSGDLLPGHKRGEGVTSYGGGGGVVAKPYGGDTGGASRYFTTFPPFAYFPKCDRADREKGCEYLPKRDVDPARAPGSDGRESPRAGAGRKAKRRNHHPTVKSTDLMRWLVRLVCPPGGIVLDPFAGSGSTGVACSAEGFRFIGLELSEEYAEIARARIVGDAPLFNVGGG